MPAWIETSSARHRLVEHEQRGSSASARAIADALALAARELPRVARARTPGSRPTSSSSSRDAAPTCARRDAVRAQRLGDDVADRQPRIERGERVLEDDAQLAAQRAPLARRRARRSSRPSTTIRPACGRGELEHLAAASSSCRSPTRRRARASRRRAASKLMPSTARTRADLALEDAPLSSGWWRTRSSTSSTTLALARAAIARPARARAVGRREQRRARARARRAPSSLGAVAGGERWPPALAAPATRARGSTSRQTSIASGQRGANGQPGGRSVERRRRALDRRQRAVAGRVDARDRAEQPRRVRHPRRCRRRSSTPPVSTIRPAYMTAMRSAKPASSARSWRDHQDRRAGQLARACAAPRAPAPGP